MCVEEFLMVKQKEMLEAAFAKLYREFQEKSVQKQATQLLVSLFILVIIFSFLKGTVAPD
jgi:hypothetical protein